MKKKLIGREKEKEILLKVLETPEAELVAVLGRRRVGKTFLVRSVYKSLIRFEITGLQDVTVKKQLNNFAIHLRNAFGEIAPKEKPADWLEAFQQLIECWEKSVDSDTKSVIFLDELPWLAGRKSGFLDGLSYFWNSWAVKKNVVIIICGSAASWMIQQVVYNKGGLHNRITRRIHLMPFNLYETNLFLRSKEVFLDPYQITQLYMAMGGIPHYLKEVEAGKSAIQNIEQICFSSTGLLNDEFMKLYPALFENATHHISIIHALGSKWKGLTRQEIIRETALPDGGNLSRYLNELLHSGFISLYNAFGKKQKDVLYRLTDEYSLFYLHFIQHQNKYQFTKDTWQNLSQTPTFKSWTGYAFENLCLKHIDQIKKALGISGIYSETSSYYHQGKADQQGVQIDLLIDRKDNVINIFELKFYVEPFIFTKSYANNLREKMSVFKQLTGTRKQIFVSLLSVFGIKPNEYSIGLISNSMAVDVLFEEV
jgi:AAA+ ATPase superfamily predicted ATPase